MTRPRAAGFDLRAALGDRGFTPRAADAPAIVALLVAQDGATKEAVHALLELGAPAVDALRSALPTAHGNGRVRIAEALGRVALRHGELLDDVAALLADAEPRVRRAAARSLGKTGDRRFVPLLSARLVALQSRSLPLPLAEMGGGPLGDDEEQEQEPASKRASSSPELEGSERRALVEALGKLGAALPELDVSEDRLLERAVSDATRRSRRDALREGEPTTIPLDATAPRDLEVRLTCRAGLEEILVEEAGERGLEARATGDGHVTAVLRRGEALGRLRELRCADGVALVARTLRGTDVDAVAAALADDETVTLLRALTRGPLRFRLAWGTGHARARTRDVATRLAALRPELVDDPRESPWEARIAARALVLVPRALPDLRFADAPEHVAASSHPTVAAALARVAGVEPDDVVWDPFCGAGLELLERARLGPAARLVGTDTDRRALVAAASNAERSGVTLDLHEADARRFAPRERPTLVLTNPPLGHRMERTGIGPLFEELIAHLARIAAPRIRLVWLTPRPDLTQLALERAGFDVATGAQIDLGGVTPTLQTASRGHAPG